MPTADQLAALFSLDDLPACDRGMALAKDFLESAVRALDSGNSSEFNSRFATFNLHRRACDHCMEQ